MIVHRKPCFAFKESLILNKKQQAQNGVTHVKPHQDLIANPTEVSAPPRSEILNQEDINLS